MALGANLQDPARQLSQAAEELAAVGTVLGRSAIYRTEPVGGPAGQPPYLNAVVLLRTHADHPDPRTLLAALLRIERLLGRDRQKPHQRWGPRTMDLDLLDLDGRMFVGPAVTAGEAQLPALRLPHPRLHQRAFVLAPLCDLEPGWRHPVLKARADELLQQLDATGVAPAAAAW